MIRADELELGTRVYVRPSHPYDRRCRFVGEVMLDPEARHALYGGEAPDGSREVTVAARESVEIERPEPEPITPLWDEPARREVDPDEADRAAFAYERGIEARAAVRGW
ncbi:MAG: hypothetical protein IT379_40020 [Deltaproteobacteria bacterium]|nr:hypothetical protein [Deltaproteobacteria bacterium]